MNIITGYGVTQIADRTTENALMWYRKELNKARTSRDFWRWQAVYWFAVMTWNEFLRDHHLPLWATIVFVVGMVIVCDVIRYVIRRREKNNDLYRWKVTP